MDRDKAREALLGIEDAAVRESETMRIEGLCYLDYAVSCLYIAKHGKMPEKERIWRMAESLQSLLYDSAANPTPEQAARRKYANDVLDAEFRQISPKQ